MVFAVLPPLQQVVQTVHLHWDRVSEQTLAQLLVINASMEYAVRQQQQQLVPTMLYLSVDVQLFPLLPLELAHLPIQLVPTVCAAQFVRTMVLQLVYVLVQLAQQRAIRVLMESVAHCLVLMVQHQLGLVKLVPTLALVIICA